jgi:hypothetical protein
VVSARSTADRDGQIVLKRREREIEAPLIEAPTCFVKSRTESYLPRCVSLLTARARRGLTGQSSGQRRALACSVTNDAVVWLVRIARRFVVESYPNQTVN